MKFLNFFLKLNADRYLVKIFPKTIANVGIFSKFSPKGDSGGGRGWKKKNYLFF